MKVLTTRIGGLPAAVAADPRLPALAEWGARLSRLGIAPGEAGNLSVRVANGFVVSRTQVELAAIGPDDWVLVTGLERRGDGNLEVLYRGDHVPSRDGFVHGTVYARQPAAGAIFHLHDSDMLHKADRLGVVATEQYFAAGTTESVLEIERLLQRHPGVDYFVLVEHGIVAWAADIDAAGELVEEWHRRAREIDD